MSPKLTVVTLANAGRLTHVARQTALIPPAVEHIVVALDDARQLRSALPGSRVITGGQENLAAARNTGGDEACRRGADTVIFLDADCLPAAQMLPRYEEALARHPGAVVAGPVTYLPEGVISTDTPDPHPARPNPPAGTTQRAETYELFWSLSFAVTGRTWRRIRDEFGGFCEDYVGYGAEDTDFGQRLRAADIELRWVGGAHAFHQHHPVSDPPVEHLADIVDNAARFHRIWGWWPMSGWLEKFRELGLADFRDGRWVVT